MAGDEPDRKPIPQNQIDFPRHRPVAHHHMSCHLRIVAQDAIVSNNTVMCNVAVRHDKAIVADLRCPAVATAAIDGHEFTEANLVAQLVKRP